MHISPYTSTMRKLALVGFIGLLIWSTIWQFF